MSESKGNTAQRPYFVFCTHLACIFSVISHNSSLQGVSLAASSLYNLTKNLTAQYAHNLCAVLPKKYDINYKEESVNPALEI